MRSVTMSVNASKFTGRMFAKAVVKLYQHLSKDKAAKDAAKANKDVTPHGKQTVKQLVGQNQGVTSIEIQDRSIKAFERIARKYGVDFAIKKVKGENKYLVFFKGRDMDALKSAFAEYTNQQLNRQKRPSLRMKLKRIKTRSINQQRNPVRNQHRSQSR